MPASLLQPLLAALVPLDGGDGDSPLPNDPRRPFEGPWLQQQLFLSLGIGLTSLLLFSLSRRRYPTLFAPRTKLAGFTPHVANLDAGVFAWIMPTLRTPEPRILHIVGLDAAVLLAFFKTCFWVLTVLSLWSCAVLMPVNWHHNGSIDGVRPSDEQRNATASALPAGLPTPGGPFPWSPPRFSAYHFTHLLTIYVTSFVVLRAMAKGGRKFIRNRQLYALDLLASIPARTVELRALPEHLRDERALAEYFEACGLAVESTAVGREVGNLADLLQRRAEKLYALERAWCQWLGNPTQAEGYDPDAVAEALQARAAQLFAQGAEAHGTSRRLTPGDLERTPLLSGGANVAGLPKALGDIQPKSSKPRPTQRVNWFNPFSKRVDSLDKLAVEFYALDQSVRRARSKERPSASGGYVTFVDAASAQIAAQTVHYPIPGYCKTSLAPEPRDIIWSNVSLAPLERRLRQLLVSAFTFTLFVFYIPPLTFLASFLSPGAIRRYIPWLWAIIEKNQRLEALVSTSLPSVVLIAFNNLLPLILEWTAYLQGLRAKSLVELSVLKRYHLFLLISVIFIFLITRTLWGVIADLANNPARVLEKVAQSLPGARNFSLSYVVLQSLAVIPLQLLQLPLILMRAWGRLFARTPREHAELNAPPQLYAGSVYPAALIVFTLSVVYSIVSPLITIFGALYFGLGYVVFKYKLLFVFYKAYESKGQAWPLSSRRCIWALGIFQVFHIGLFSVRKQLFLSFLCLPVLITTVWYGRHMSKQFSGLEEHINLSSITEVARQDSQAAGMPTGTVINPLLALRADNHAPDDEQTALARRRYAAKDETLFVAQRDTHTDYREPPAAGYYTGTLDTGRRRYGHPALTGKLPEPWLPIPAEEAAARESLGATSPEEIATAARAGTAEGMPGGSGVRLNVSAISKKSDVLVLSLRRRKSSLLKRGRMPPLARSKSTLSTVSTPAGDALDRAGPSSTMPADDAEGIWGNVDEGPRGTGPGAAIGEAISGVESVAPARRRAGGLNETLPAVIVREEPDEQRTDAGDAAEEDEEDEDEDEYEGVYVHRRPRQLPGSFPGAGGDGDGDDD